MAFADYDDERNRELQALLGAASPAPSTGGGPGGAPGASAPAPAPGGAQGTGFVNFNTLLGLNAPEAQEMAQGVAGSLDAQTQAVQSGLSSMQAGYNSAAAPRPEGAPPGNPLAPTLAEYGGDAWGGLLGQASTAAATGRTATNGGLSAVMQDTYGAGRNYTSGESNLDAALAGAAGGGTIRAAAGRAQGLPGMLGTAGQAGPQRAGGAAGGAPWSQGGTGRPAGDGFRPGQASFDEEERRRRQREQAGRRSDQSGVGNPFGGG